MKKLWWFVLIFFSFSARADFSDSLTALGLKSSAAPTRDEINTAYKDSIRELMGPLMRGDPEAAIRSQKLAKARMLLLSADRCEIQLIPTGLHVTVNNNDINLDFLHQSYPKLFPPNFHVLSEQEMNSTMEAMVLNPKLAIESLIMGEKEATDRFPDDPNAAQITRFQKIIAEPLGQYLRRQRLSRPEVLQIFENELVKVLWSARRNEDLAIKSLQLVKDLSLSPGPVLVATIPYLMDDSQKVVRLAEGAILSAAIKYGLSFAMEDLLLKSTNAEAITILASSAKPFAAKTTAGILERLRTIQSPRILSKTVHLLFKFPDMQDQILDVLRARQEDESETWANRFFAAEILLDNSINTHELERFLITSISKANDLDLSRLRTWCYSSNHCPNSVKSTIQMLRTAGD